MSDNKKFDWRPGQKGKRIAAYPYEDENGVVLYRKVKFLTGNPQYPKSYRFERLVDGRWITDSGILDGIRRVPFRLSRLAKNKAVVVCEGEKDALNLAGLGFSTTCAPFGAGDWPSEITPCFSGKVIFILYDIDTKYCKHHPEMVAANLWGTAAEIFICDLELFFQPVQNPLTIHERDITDYINRFPSMEFKISAVQEVLRKARPYVPPEIVGEHRA